MGQRGLRGEVGQIKALAWAFFQRKAGQEALPSAEAAQARRQGWQIGRDGMEITL